jgi:hypothetical protein
LLVKIVPVRHLGILGALETLDPCKDRDVFQLKREQTEQLRNAEIQKWQMSVRENQNANDHGYDNSNIVKTHKRKMDDVENTLDPCSYIDVADSSLASDIPVVACLFHSSWK